jgi:hypothetical protein
LPPDQQSSHSPCGGGDVRHRQNRYVNIVQYIVLTNQNRRKESCNFIFANSPIADEFPAICIQKYL